jgi:hypothetical protein
MKFLLYQLLTTNSLTLCIVGSIQIVPYAAFEFEHSFGKTKTKEATRLAMNFF